MRLVDADSIKADYPNRRSLNQVLDAAETIISSEMIEELKEDICDNYCKIPYKYSKHEWEIINDSDDSPCNNCPLLKISL